MTAAAAVIVIAEDEAMVRTTMANYLRKAGYEVVEAANGLDAADVLSSRRVDLAVLDVMLPRRDGFSLLEEFGATTPCLMLTALGAEDDRLKGLAGGAQDYVVKPFSPREVVLRVANILGRSRPSVETVEAGDVVCNLRSRTASVAGRPLDLTTKEFDLLVHLVRSPGQAFSRAELLEAVWQSSPEWQDAATVTVHVRRLRTKIEQDPSNPLRMHTVWGHGYRFDPWLG